MNCENLQDINASGLFKGKCPFVNSCDGTGVTPDDCKLVKQCIDAIDRSKGEDWKDDDQTIAY